MSGRSMAGAGPALIRALRARAPELDIEGSTSTGWASMTFTGARHCIRCLIPIAAYEAFSEGLDVVEFSLPGHIVADIAIESAERTGDAMRLEIGILTVEDC